MKSTYNRFYKHYRSHQERTIVRSMIRHGKAEEIDYEIKPYDEWESEAHWFGKSRKNKHKFVFYLGNTELGCIWTNEQRARFYAEKLARIYKHHIGYREFDSNFIDVVTAGNKSRAVVFSVFEYFHDFSIRRCHSRRAKKLMKEIEKGE